MSLSFGVSQKNVLMSSSSLAVTILNVATQYSLYTSSIICIAGIIGSALNVFVFTNLKIFRKNRCAFYLIIESIGNVGYLLLTLINSTLTTIEGDDPAKYSLTWCRSKSILLQIFSLISTYMICLATCDQFFSTSHRPPMRQMCTHRLARSFTALVSFIIILHSIVYSLFLENQPSVGCAIANQIWLRYSSWVFYPGGTCLLPIGTNLLFSALAFHNVRHIIRRQIPIVRRRFDRQITSMILIRVVFFVIFTFPFSIYRIYAINFPISQADILQYTIGRLVQAVFTSFFILNFAVSFYLFMISSSRYRRQVNRVLIKKCWRRCKTCCHTNQNQVEPENPTTASSDNEL